MCPPKAPKRQVLPPPRPTAPAPEKTTKAVVSGTRKKKNMPGSGLKGSRQTDRGGSASLQLQRLDTGRNPNLNNIG